MVAPAHIVRSACPERALVDPADQFHADRLLFVVEKKVLGTAHALQYCNLTTHNTCTLCTDIHYMCIESVLDCVINLEVAIVLKNL